MTAPTESSHGRVTAPVYCALVHYPIKDRAGETVTTAVTNLDVHDISRSARTYGLSGYYVVTPIEAQRQLVERILSHWKTGAGATRVPERAEALSRVEVIPSIEEVIQRIQNKHGKAPRVVATAARSPEGTTVRTFAEEAAHMAETQRPQLILFGTGHGLQLNVLEEADSLLEPIDAASGYNHLSVRAAVAIVFDRLFGR